MANSNDAGVSAFTGKLSPEKFLPAWAKKIVKDMLICLFILGIILGLFGNVISSRKTGTSLVAQPQPAAGEQAAKEQQKVEEPQLLESNADGWVKLTWQQPSGKVRMIDGKSPKIWTPPGATALKYTPCPANSNVSLLSRTDPPKLDEGGWLVQYQQEGGVAVQMLIITAQR